jgi:membrane-anchored glycerophosphoryl diester phosphodiesterase (GDPDase)
LQQAMTPQVLAIPAPEMGSVFSYAWERGKQTWAGLLVVGIVHGLIMGLALVPLFLVQLIIQVAAGAAAGDTGNVLAVVVNLVLFVVYMLAAIPLTFGAFLAFLKAARGQTPEVGDLFVCFRHGLGASIGAGLLVGIAVTVGSILLVVPGIILAVRLIFVPYLVVDEGLGAMDSLRESWSRTDGHFWQLLGGGIVAQLIMYAGSLVFGIGMIPAAIWAYLALATYYLSITAVKRPAISA